MAWMKLGTRLTLAFAVLVALLLGLGAVAVERVRRVHAALDDVSRVHSSALQLAGRGLVQAQRSSALIDEALLAEDGPRVMAALAELDRNRVAVDRLCGEVEAVIGAEPARQAYLAVQAARAESRRAFQPAREALVRGARAEAARRVVQEVLPARARLVDAWQAFMDAERAAIRDGAAVGQSELARARRDLAAAVLVAGLVGAGLSVAVVRRVGASLEGAARAARELAAGDLRTRVEVTRRDEIGQVQGALALLQGRVTGVLRAVQADAGAVDGSAAGLAARSQALGASGRRQAELVAEVVMALHRIATRLAHEGTEVEQARTSVWHEVGQASRLVGELDAEVRRSGLTTAEVAGAVEALAAEARALRSLLEEFRLPAEAGPIGLQAPTPSDRQRSRVEGDLPPGPRPGATGS